MPKPRKLAKGLWRWTERHPEWHPGEFGAEVACFAVDAGEDTLLIDPLLPADPEPVHALIESILGDRLTIFVTIPYHVRSAEPLWQRYRRQARDDDPRPPRLRQALRQAPPASRR